MSARSLLDDDQVQHREVGADDAAADRLAAALARAAAKAAEAGVAGRHEEADASGDEDALLHREALLVLPADDLEDVALPLLEFWWCGDWKEREREEKRER